MEDDDEFGDLYTDVLQPLTTSSAHPQPPPVQPPPPPHPPSRSIDLNNSIPSDDEEILYGAPSSSKLSFGQPDSNMNLNKTDGVSGKTETNLEVADSGARVFGSSSSVLKVEDKGFAEDPSFLDDSKGGFSQVKEEALEGNFGIEDAGQEDEFLIPGLSSSGARVLDRGGGEGEGGDDWDDSDSEDDLQIVLNDNNGDGTMGMNRGGGGDEEDDEDGDNLVIVADNNDPNFHHQPGEELQEWGDDSNQAPEGGGERKDLLGADVGKVDRGAAIAPKTGYNSHGYHPFHSQFKYVRPGAAPMPGAAPETTGGAPGQVRPPANMLPFAGRGRGDWRPMQKNFHQGYGMPGWGNNGAARGFGSGLDFTLPSHKTIFEVDIDGFEEKPWRLQGIDMSDFFNFGLNEESWKEYCKQLEQLRLESTMQSKIRVYESGRTEQEYDPDLPPELAAAAGIHDGPSENHIIGKSDMHSDLAKGSQRARMQLPTGRAIQVETGFGERLPSIDTRPPRVRDSDAIIEIVLQESAEDESAPGNDGAEQLGDDPSKENYREGLQENDITAEDNHFDKIPQDYNGGKGEHFGRRAPLMGSVRDETAEGDRVSQFSDTQDHLDSRGKTSSYPSKKLSSHNHMERRAKRRAPDRSPRLTDSGNLHDKTLVDNEKEESTESVGGKQKQSPTSSREERDVGQKDDLQDEVVAADGSSGMGKEETAFDSAPVDTFKDEKQTRTMKKQKLVTRAERSSVEKVDEGEETKAARSSENSKARSRSGSSRDQRNMRESVEEEVIQTGGLVRGGNIRPSLNEDERHVRSRSRDERKERERRQISMKGVDDLSSRKKWDPNLEYRPHVKPENLDRRKGRGYEGVWQDEDPHVGRMRTEDMRKRNHGEEMVSRHRHKVRETERIDKDEHRSKTDSWKGDYDRDVASQQNMDDSLRIRHNSSDSKRRKEEVHARRGDLAEREEALRIHRESTGRRKRERDDNLDQHKRDEQARLKDDDQHSLRHKEEGWLQRERIEKPRERDDWKEREGHRGVRSGRSVDDKAWAGHSRLKEEYREYPFKETVREQPGRRDRVENESLSRHRGHEDTYVHGNKVNNDERISKQERGYTSTDTHRAQEKKHKESVRKGKESDVATHNSLAPSRRNREDHNSLRTERVSSRAAVEQRRDEQNPTARQSSKRRKEDASSEDEQQDSRRGRSKLERWTSHKEKDFTLDVVKPPNVKEPDDNGPSSTSKPPSPAYELPKSEETVKKSKPPAEENDDTKPAEVKHLDTVEKLKKRSERFKLPMPSEKEVKKMENEALPETRPDSEVKPERPPRKRRWTSG